ncbi:hypothetical protein ACMAUO_20500 [Gluconacetobacter sp. Hr-1-5]|uniref:hypothetical protein n=1 Tax=Gluconacetobacter sp. Hr-1-5 TaxID=3395370 RepID=UPI003B52BEF4
MPDMKMTDEPDVEAFAVATPDGQSTDEWQAAFQDLLDQAKRGRSRTDANFFAAPHGPGGTMSNVSLYLHLRSK